MYRVIRSVLIFFLVAVFVGCEYWNKDMLGYLEYWSETVQMGKVEVSDATIQKNDAGADTIPVAATPTIAAYVINPQSYELLAEIGDSSSADKSVRVSDSAVQSKAQVVAHEATMLKVQLGSADGSLEHTEFRVDFEAIRKDTMQSSGKVIGVTLRYNTPPVAPTPVVWNYDSSQYEVVKAGEKWEADDRSGILYWAYDDSITEETDPNCAKWFSIGGTRHLVAACKVPDVQVDGLSVFQFNTNYGGTSVAAVDSEGISSPVIASGQAVPPATYVIKYDANGADGGTAPASQNKTQYTDITLATNSGGLTRIGYRFTGWNTAPDGTGTPYSAGATYSADEGVTLYAQWTKVTDVTFGKTGEVNHDTSVTLSAPAGATIYYKTDGDQTWNHGQQGQPVTIKLYNAAHMPPSPTGVDVGIPENDIGVTIKAYAEYADGTQSTETTGTYSLKQYTVSYVGNGNTGGTVPSPDTFYSGGSVNISDEGSLTKTGYTFDGWSEKQDSSDKTYTAGEKVSFSGDTTLYAQWGELRGDAAAVAEELKKITTPGTYMVKVTGSMTSGQVYDIRDALLDLKSNAPSARVELDLSGTNLTELPDYAFNPENNNKNAATNLTKVILPNTVTHIRSCVFDCCTNLTYVDLGSGVRYIGYQAFDFCYKLATIRVSASNPPTLDKEPFRLEGGSYVSRTVEVPQASLLDYQSSPWANLEGPAGTKVTIKAQQ